MNFKDSPAFASFSVDDTQKAKDFYGKTLGLPVRDEIMGTLSIEMNGARTMIYPKPDHKAATFTVLNFPVDNVEQAVDELSSKGVTFERYREFKQDAKGIASESGGPKMAWFKDPAGNIISVLEAA
jgi:catechol 2,3-dioxygenase-like lactoylglutathione lyase family enzyme